MRLERLRRVTCKGGAYCRVDVEDYDDVKRFLGPRVSRRWKSGRHEQTFTSLGRWLTTSLFVISCTVDDAKE